MYICSIPQQQYYCGLWTLEGNDASSACPSKCTYHLKPFLSSNQAQKIKCRLLVQYNMWYASCTKKFYIVRAYCKCSWIVWYINEYCMNRIVSLNRAKRTIHRYESLKWVFFFFFGLKFVILFDLNKLLDFFNTKLLGNLIEFFFFILFILQNLD